MLTTAEMRLFLAQNPNALLAKCVIPAGTALSPGLYWNLGQQEVEAVSAPRPATHDCVRLADRLDAPLAEVSRGFALGGGGHAGTPLPPEGDARPRGPAA
ncbi:MAG: hypothetical protein HY691_11275 [Chloroflexi bacterium]|nr:hypothetical protein [Chloroflexota bacterium]